MQIQGSHTNRSEPAGGGWHHVYSGSTDVEGHAPWHWSMVIFFTDDGLSFFQLSSLPGCRPRAGERLRGEAGWSHRWGQQGAAGAFRASCQRLRLPEAAFKPWKSSALQEWLGKATSVQDPDSVRCLNFDPGLRRSGGRRADRAGLDALWVESMFAGRRTPPKTPAAQICCFLSGLQIFFLNAVNEMNLWILFGRNFTTFACWKLWTNKTKQAAVCAVCGLSSWLLVPFDYCELNFLFIVFCMTFYTYFLNKVYQFVWLCRHFPA